MPTNPYKIDGPALISVSGGRTSAFMLRQILDAHGGELPSDVVAVFCNTGKEHEETLRFLKELGQRWCQIVWLEYTHDDGAHGFRVVDYCSASRRGEPFAAAIRGRGYLPNPITRFCTAEMKIRTGNRYAKSIGWESWTRCVGLRADERRRVMRLKGEGNEDAVCPMYLAGHGLNDVLAFWKTQPFDLTLPGGNNLFGNCDLCFLKARAKIETIMRTNPETADWWIEQERAMGAPFRIDRPSYGQMLTQLRVQGRLFDDAIEDDSLPCECTD